jgi:hypothetical protein
VVKSGERSTQVDGQMDPINRDIGGRVYVLPKLWEKE